MTKAKGPLPGFTREEITLLEKFRAGDTPDQVSLSLQITKPRLEPILAKLLQKTADKLQSYEAHVRASYRETESVKRCLILVEMFKVHATEWIKFLDSRSVNHDPIVAQELKHYSNACSNLIKLCDYVSSIVSGEAEGGWEYDESERCCVDDDRQHLLNSLDDGDDPLDEEGTT
jgi:hypothetical protein